MEIKTKRGRTTIVVHLEDWEASDLVSVMNRISGQPKVGKSEFSMREKSTCRRFMVSVQEQMLNTLTKGRW